MQAVAQKGSGGTEFGEAGIIMSRLVREGVLSELRDALEG